MSLVVRFSSEVHIMFLFFNLFPNDVWRMRAMSFRRSLLPRSECVVSRLRNPGYEFGQACVIDGLNGDAIAILGPTQI